MCPLFLKSIAANMFRDISLLPSTTIFSYCVSNSLATGFVSKNHNSIQKNRIINDNEIIEKFTNKIEVPKWVVEKENNKFLNKIFENLGKITRLGF